MLIEFKFLYLCGAYKNKKRVVVITSAFHQCDRGSIPGQGARVDTALPSFRGR